MKKIILFSVVFLSFLGLYNCAKKTDSTLGKDIQQVNNDLNYYDTGSVVFLLYKHNEFPNSHAKNQFFPYNLLETKMHLKQLEEKKENRNKRDIYSYQGTYSFGNKKYIGVVDFKGVEENGNLGFVISIGSSKGCTSSLKGNAKLIKPGFATYKDSTSGCSLSFMFKNDKLEVQENQCRLFHGATCQFHGTFNKE